MSILNEASTRLPIRFDIFWVIVSTLRSIVCSAFRTLKINKFAVAHEIKCKRKSPSQPFYFIYIVKIELNKNTKIRTLHISFSHIFRFFICSVCLCSVYTVHVRCVSAKICAMVHSIWTPYQRNVPSFVFTFSFSPPMRWTMNIKYKIMLEINAKNRKVNYACASVYRQSLS